MIFGITSVFDKKIKMSDPNLGQIGPSRPIVPKEDPYLNLS